VSGLLQSRGCRGPNPPPRQSACTPRSPRSAAGEARRRLLLDPALSYGRVHLGPPDRQDCRPWETLTVILAGLRPACSSPFGRAPRPTYPPRRMNRRGRARAAIPGLNKRRPSGRWASRDTPPWPARPWKVTSQMARRSPPGIILDGAIRRLVPAARRGYRERAGSPVGRTAASRAPMTARRRV
jgi:hypothetical protein